MSQNSAKNVLGLLRVYDTVLGQLRSSGIIRSNNNPVADFAESLVSEAFGLSLTPKSTKGHDAVAKDGTRFEVKARRLSAENGSRQLSAIRDLGSQNFDILAGVLFNPDFTVFRAALVPWNVIVEKSNHVASTNSARFILRDDVWAISGVQDVTEMLNQHLE